MKKAINYTYLTLASLLLIFGWLFLATLSAPASLQIFKTTNYYLLHQLFAIGVGLILAAIAFKTPLHIIKRVAPWLFLGNIILLVLVFLPIVGARFWGASRWISIGGATFQPSEFLKITSILYLASWLSNRFTENPKKGWLPTIKKGYDNFVKILLPFVAFVSLISIILLFQKDATTLGVIGVTLLVVYFSVGTSLWHLPLLGLFGALGAFILIKLEPYRMQRLLLLLHPETDPLGLGFHLKQSLMAIGSGGWFGKGLGMSTQKFGFLPQAMTDSVFAIVGEETGIIGCVALIILLVAFFWVGLYIARKSTNTFARLTAVGFSFWMVFQAFVNISSTLGIFPISGVPLPFFSYGGSHIVAELIAVGIILNISKHG